MNAFRVTYTNGDAYMTSANGTLEEFTAYITQSYHVEENPVTGQETKLFIAKVEQLPEAGQLYTFEYEGKETSFVVTEVTAEHVFYKLEDSRHVYPMCWETWSANTDNRKLKGM